MDASHLLHEWGPFAVSLLVGVPPWLKIWFDKRAAARIQADAAGQVRNDLVRIAQEAAGEVIEDLRAENARVRDQLARIEREFGEFRRMHDGMIAAKDAKIAFLEQQLQLASGEARQWQAIAETYDRLLTSHDIPHPFPGQPVWQAKEEGLLLVSDNPPETEL